MAGSGMRCGPRGKQSGMHYALACNCALSGNFMCVRYRVSRGIVATAAVAKFCSTKANRRGMCVCVYTLRYGVMRCEKRVAFRCIREIYDYRHRTWADEFREDNLQLSKQIVTRWSVGFGLKY